MANRMALKTVVLHRDGKRVEVRAGQPFEFSDDEMKELNKLPGTVRRLNDESTMLRAPAAGPLADEAAVVQAKEDAKPRVDDASDL